MVSAQPLPPRLANFLARYPPQLYSAKFTGIKLPLTRREAKEAAISKAAALADSADSSSSIQTPSESDPSTLAEPIATIAAAAAAASSSSSYYSSLSSSEPSETFTPIPTAPTPQKLPANPFLPRRNFKTGRWSGPKIGLRRQADLFKLAKTHGIEELLPASIKSSAFKEAKILQRGLRIKGTGEGQKVKGHKWERHVGATLEKRRKAMEGMPDLIREWKQRGHGRGWKKYPK